MRRRDRNKQYWIGVVTGASVVFGIVMLIFATYQNWFVTYENNFYKFRLKIPATWTISENTNNAAAIFSSPVEGKLDTFRENVNIVVQDVSQLPQPQNFRDYTKQAIFQMKVVFKENMEVFASEETIWAGQKAHKFVIAAEGTHFRLKYFMLWTLYGNYAYQFTYTALEKRYDDYIDKVQKMARTFEITR